MRNIDLQQAYDDQTQELLIDQTIIDNLTDAEAYDKDKQEEYFKYALENNLVFNTESDLMRAVKNDFFGIYSSELDEMSNKYGKLFYYMHVDYSQVLEECIVNGYIDLVKYAGKFVVFVINPDGFYETEFK